MKILFSLLALTLSIGASTPSDAQPQDLPAEGPKAVPIRASKIILVGDSTMQPGSGWGGVFCAHHVTSFAACVNLARGGRSTLSYRDEGSWALAMAEANTTGFVATWVLIQFGHNDQPGKAGRSTDLATEFPVNLRRYVAEVRSAGAQPVLITPLTRRQFKNGVLQRELAPWAEAIMKIAAELKVPVVDLYAKSAAAVETMGPLAANEFAQSPPSAETMAAAKTGTTLEAPPAVALSSTPMVADKPDAHAMAQRKLLFDYTHLGLKGAEYFAKMVTDELAVQVPAMRPLLYP